MSPFWKFMPTRVAHELAVVGLRIYADLFGQDDLSKWQSFDWKGLHFPNRLGVAGGVDKDAEEMLSFQKIGTGFVEVGTITPYPQNPNPGKIMSRDWTAGNLWNKMGFPSSGANEVAINLMHARQDVQIPIFVNIGKNRNTPNEKAANDYVQCIEKLKPYADAFVVNISSPNTKGLRDLQSRESLEPLLSKVVSSSGKIPVLLKLSPDMTREQLETAVLTAADCKVSGLILTNTTTFRPANSSFPVEGGLSGKSLAEKSKLALKSSIEILKERRKEMLIVSVGGVSTAEDVKERLALGADLVQIYSAMVFKGPGIFRKIGGQL